MSFFKFALLKMKGIVCPLKTIGLLWVTAVLMLPVFALESLPEQESFSPELAQDEAFKVAVDQVTEVRVWLFDFRKQLLQIDEAEKNKNRGRLDQNYKQARSEMVKVIQDIDNSSLKITSLLNQLYQHKVNLKQELANLTETKQNLEIGKQYLNQLLLLVYKLQREIYDEQGVSLDELKVFMKTNAIPQLLAGNDTLHALLVQINDLLKQATLEQKEKTDTIRNLTILKTQSQKALEHYHQEIEKLKHKKAFLANFMQLYNEKKLQSIAMSGAKSSAYLLQDTIQTMVADLIAKNYTQLPSISEQLNILEQQMDSSEDENSPLAWPAYPVRQILTVFKDPEFEKEYGFKHLGLQLALEEGTPVYAMRDGVVYHTSTTGGVNRMMLLHTQGYMTIYTAMQTIEVQPGDIVRRGQYIGKSGGEIWSQDASFLDHSPNLSFQIYKDGVAIDPLTVLDLSVVMDRETVLPEEYRLKYFNDQYVRPIDISNLSLIKGESLEQRSQTFLNAYAVGVYRDLAFRDQVVAGTNIDRDMVICIWFAESTLGKFLSTNNNIGNVGNNDRGDRIAYDNPYNGARLIPLTLNNQYLGHYHTIKQLSRYGNADGKIYASSPINRQTNVQKCLSKIKWFYIPEDYPFRTGINPMKSTVNKAQNSTFTWTTVLQSLEEEKLQIMNDSLQTKIAGVPLD